MAQSKVNQITNTAISTYNGIISVAAQIPLATLDVASSVQKGACGVISTGISTSVTAVRGISNTLKMNGGR